MLRQRLCEVVTSYIQTAVEFRSNFIIEFWYYLNIFHETVTTMKNHEFFNIYMELINNIIFEFIRDITDQKKRAGMPTIIKYIYIYIYIYI